METHERSVDQYWRNLQRVTSNREWQTLPREERSRVIGEGLDQGLNWLISLPADERFSYLTKLTPGECSLLLSIAGSNADTAINLQSEEELARGVLAASFLVGVEDSREIVRKLALLGNSARLLGTSLQEMLSRIKDTTTPEGAKFIEDFAQSGGVDLQAFGYAECWNPEVGFYYGSLWGSRASRSQIDKDRLRPGQSIPPTPD